MSNASRKRQLLALARSGGSAAVDVHPAGPADCSACAAMAPGRACLSHTCPDCGSIVHAETNERGELKHRCP